jgi:hypothetical protein
MRNYNSDEPDIVITEEDLDAAEDFFERSGPKPLKPTALVEAQCTKSGRKFYILFEQADDGGWKLRGSLDESTVPTISNGSLRTKIQSNLVSGSIDWRGLACPHCSTSHIAKCGQCGRLSCHPSGKQGAPFQCAWCGNTGNLSGYIKTLDGSRGKKK